MINRVTLTGRLTREPQLRQTASGISVVSFTLAVDRQWEDKNGQRQADFINCVIWRKQAEAFCNYNHKGSLVGIDGRLQTRSYQDKDGKRVFVTEVAVDNFSFLESKNASSPAQGAQTTTPSTYNPNPPKTQDTPPATDPFGSDKTPIDVSDDDLPF